MATQNSVKKPNPIKERWDLLDPKTKKMISLGGGLGVVMIVAFMIVSGSSNTGGEKKTVQGQIANALMPEEGARDLGLQATGKEVRQLRGDVRTLQGENARLKNDWQRSQAADGANTQESRLIQEIGDMRTQMAEIQRNQTELARQQQMGGGPGAINGPRPAAAVGAPMAPIPGEPMSAPSPAFGGIRAVNQQPIAAPQPVGPPVRAESSSGQPQVVPTSGGTGAQAAPASSGIRSVKGENLYLPAGSILQGVLLSGVDAPSGKAAMKDPVPVLARLKKEAILANRFRADVRECFMLLETVGDIASERAMMRAITLSCVKKDSTIVEVNIAGYGVGEDGRAGLRGELITRQGSVLGKAALAGFADGLAQAFGGNKGGLMMGGIGMGGGGLSSDQFETGGLMGASSALDRISKWYLDRADELNPTISIDSGRQITVVLTKGRELSPLTNEPPTATVAISAGSTGIPTKR